MDDQLKYEKELAINNMRAGVIAGLVIFGIMLGKFLITQFSDANQAQSDGLQDPFFIIDLVLVFLLIWGVTRYSRASAIGLFMYYLLDKVVHFLDSGSFVVLGIASVMLFFFARAIKGAFDYHKLMRRIDKNHQPTKKWMWLVMTPIFLVFSFFMTVGILTHYQILPASYVKSYQDITAKDLRALNELQLIDEDDTVTGFYSYGLFSIKEGGVFMTDTELVVFAEDDGEVYYDSMVYEKIDWVKQLSQGNEFEDALYQIAGREQYQGFQFSLSIENNGHAVFIQNLATKISPPMPKIEIPLPQIEIYTGSQRN